MSKHFTFVYWQNHILKTTRFEGSDFESELKSLKKCPGVTRIIYQVVDEQQITNGSIRQVAK